MVKSGKSGKVVKSGEKSGEKLEKLGNNWKSEKNWKIVVKVAKSVEKWEKVEKSGKKLEKVVKSGEKW